MPDLDFRALEIAFGSPDMKLACEVESGAAAEIDVWWCICGLGDVGYCSGLLIEVREGRQIGDGKVK